LVRKELGKRILQIIIVLFGVSFLTFCLTYLSPGDPIEMMYMRGGMMPSQKVIETTRESMGLNRPFIVQYAAWLKGCLQGNFGTSFFSGKPVMELLSARLWPTLKLSFCSLLMMLFVAVPVGIISAIYQNRFPDYFIRFCTFFGISIPGFWVGLMLLYLIAVKWRILPVLPDATDWKSLVLPSATLAFAMSAKYVRLVRASILEELNQDYVIGARARGTREGTILWNHVLPNAMLPLITMLGLSLGSLLGGTAVVEIIFSYPGLGNLAVTAISQRDYYVVQGYVLWIALIYMLVNLFVDISYNYLDPRIRERR
jgi:peptide/nickel transport system permease protein